MASIGFLGCGKIGKAMVRHIQAHGKHRVAFVHDPLFINDCGLDGPVVAAWEADVCRADLLVECATADVLKQNFENYARRSDLLVFSVTAFSDDEFARHAWALCKAHKSRLYLPHGAILGLDGIFDARGILTSVAIETIKSPASLGRQDKRRTVVYQGSTREACRLYPRNVNVHAEVALAGLGFDRTRSIIVSDPAVSTNAHTIRVEGHGISFSLDISASSTGGVTGSYTPVSACGSLDRILGGDTPYQFV